MRVEVYYVKDGKAAMGVYVDDIEIACPVIPIDDDVDKAKIEEADMQDLDVIIRGRLEDAYGKGSEYDIITHDGKPEAGLMYGNDECVENFNGDHYGKLYTYFQPYGSGIVYKCYYTIPDGETDWSNIDYSSPDDIVISDSWGYNH